VERQLDACTSANGYLCLSSINRCKVLVCQLRAFSFAKGGLVAARRLHEKLLVAVIQAPMEFFDRTPLGMISVLCLSYKSV
jgi:hypothetical protein